jgi:hypothetical protein
MLKFDRPLTFIFYWTLSLALRRKLTVCVTNVVLSGFPSMGGKY